MESRNVGRLDALAGDSRLPAGSSGPPLLSRTWQELAARSDRRDRLKQNSTAKDEASAPPHSPRGRKTQPAPPTRAASHSRLPL